MHDLILGRLPYSLESDPFLVKEKNLFHLYNWDLLGIKEHISLDGIHFKFKKYLVFGGIRPFVKKNVLYYEKITSYQGFPFYKSEIRSRDLTTGHESVVVNGGPNSCCPSIINGYLFYSTNLVKMPDYGLCEPSEIKILNGPAIRGLENISSLRKFGNKYLGTLIEVKNNQSSAKIVDCLPVKFPSVWKIGTDFLTPKDISPTATHVYIPYIIENKLYVNVRFGHHFYSSERILCLS